MIPNGTQGRRPTARETAVAAAARNSFVGRSVVQTVVDMFRPTEPTGPSSGELYRSASLMDPDSVEAAILPMVVILPCAADRASIEAQARANALTMMTGEEWEKHRALSDNPFRADILMAFDPEGEKPRHLDGSRP